MLKQAWNFVKKEIPAQVFSCNFYKTFLAYIFHRTFLGTCSIIITWITNFLCFSFFQLTRCLFIGLLIWFTLHLLLHSVLIMIMQIVLNLIKFVLFVCWLNKLSPSFLSQINELIVKRRRNVKTPMNVFHMV